MASSIALSPLELGPVTLSNRIVRTAHGTGYARPDITDQFIAFHEERARGGCALTILEAGSVHPTSRLELALFRDEIVDGYRRLMEAVRPHGMKVFQQLWHGGNLYPGYDLLPWAVSTVPSMAIGLVGIPMGEEEIEELIQAFVNCALKAREGGLDGVELHAGHGYVIQQFLAPSCNTRSDRWGGDLAGRSRFLMETLRRIRAAVGSDFAVGVRLSSSEWEGGVTEQVNHELVEMMQAESLIDYVNVSLGDYYRMDSIVGTMHNPAGYELPSVGKVLTAARVPRLVAGRFRAIDEVEQVLREGIADMVAMSRPHIADPMIVTKAREGRAEETRPCLSCNQGCIGGLLRGGDLGCLVNPVVGLEGTLSERFIEPTSSPKKVLIVGGGPAGMEAARVARLGGHEVILAEAGPDLGGMVNIAKRAPKLHGVADITVWLEQEIYRLGVDVRLNTYLDADDVAAEGADLVVVATGSEPRMDGMSYDNPGEIPGGLGLRHVMSSIDVLTQPLHESVDSALVSDTCGHFEAMAVCEFLLSRGVDVTLVTPQIVGMSYVSTTFRDVAALERFYAYDGKFEMLSRHRLVDVRQGECVIRPSQGAQTRVVPADLVVLISQNEPRRQLYEELKAAGQNVAMIGDSASPRDIQSAIAEGHHLARQIG